MDQKVDNGTTTNYTYNGLGRITSDGANTYTYDNNGNLVTKGTNEAFQYDWKNNLVRYQDTANNTNMYYAYDIGNVRLAKGKMTEVSSSSTTDRFAQSRKKVNAEGKDLVATSTTRTTPRNFAELGLNWQEFYHKSDNISVRTCESSRPPKGVCVRRTSGETLITGGPKNGDRPLGVSCSYPLLVV
ncbi:MAG: hypothetical protein U5N86_10480 [Planctomycetota bacterium]|nr:hypothetical protein [Planctomycetota bacterium]